MHTASVGIIGASGYSGLEATRLLAHHPRAELVFATSDRWVAQSVGARAGVTGPAAALRYLAQPEAEARAKGCDVVLLCTPAEVSLDLVPRLLDKGVKVIDLSGAFRLKDAAAYGAWYGFEHHAPQLLAGAVYGMTELFRARVREAQLVANPGCYPTAATLPLAPLLREGLVDPRTLVINAASGVTGAGRKASEEYGFCEVEGDFRAYRVLRHQHTPEIAQTLEQLGGSPAPLTFTPHLLPVRRGILCTTYAWFKPGATVEQVGTALREAYGDEPFIQLLPSAEAVSLKGVVGTNRCQIGFASDRGRLVLVSSIDNLVKGAAGQAVQNLNVMSGFDEALGLDTQRGFYP
jgi:N-acetyl-gamma-glutamyl-phosphate reductase